jgi:hypothetical protein
MAIVPQRSNGKGSLKNLQVLINENPDLLGKSTMPDEE